MAVDMFLKLDAIAGESIDKTHKGEIQILAFSFGATQSGSTHIGGGGGSGKVNFQDISFTKYIDKSTPDSSADGRERQALQAGRPHGPQGR